MITTCDYSSSYDVKELRERPYLLYQHLPRLIESHPSRYHSSLRSFVLCPCHKVGAAMRLFLEKSVLHSSQARIDELERIRPVGPYTIVSIGPGKCYQEVVLLTKLAQKIAHLRLILIEREPIPSEEIKRFCKDSLPGITISVIAFPSLDAYIFFAKQHNCSPDVLLAVDLTDNKYKVNGISLPTFVLSRLTMHRLFHRNTVVGMSQGESQEKFPSFHKREVLMMQWDAEANLKIVSRYFEILTQTREGFLDIAHTEEITYGNSATESSPLLLPRTAFSDVNGVEEKQNKKMTSSDNEAKAVIASLDSKKRMGLGITIAAVAIAFVGMHRFLSYTSSRQ